MGKYEIVKLDALVVGTGAAGYNAAIRLKKFGVENIAIVTEGVNIGTSRNTGSDKQTYYKLGLAGDMKDSVKSMAEDLFRGGGVDGDNALAEASLSARCFLNLCELGVSFPTNRYGEYVGYKTDHDPCARATSVGPLTSKEMTERLEEEAQRLNITVFDNTLAVSVIKNGEQAVGIVSVNTLNGKITLFSCTNIIFATGGPGGMYYDSVYPSCHNGSSGILFEAGAKGQNLTFWQYGLASVAPRWNVSGTYMQVLPRFVSVDENGNEYEFLNEYFSDFGEMLSMVFLKGYQWPFDSQKVLSGSSVIDLLVYRESVIKNRKVYLDYTKNPSCVDKIDYSVLSDEARIYLEKAEACFGTPIERLEKMNMPAIELYRSKGVDLYKEKLQIALCAQHNNGGVKVDMWWQSNVKGLFVCGEAAGTHGISRPGGSALNAGQVGSLRAAQYISWHKNENLDDESFYKVAEPYAEKQSEFIRKIRENKENVSELLTNARMRMSAYGGALRKKDNIQKAIDECSNELENLEQICGVKKFDDIMQAYRLRDVLLCQKMYLSAMRDFSEHYGITVGSALYYDEKGELRNGLEEIYRFSVGGEQVKDTVQETQFGENCTSTFRKVREIPEGGGFFENVWRSYRENGNVE